jgi:NAD(P)-dependent dehydrogenase (short-subunit alcohol dehydrogenase family)
VAEAEGIVKMGLIFKKLLNQAILSCMSSLTQQPVVLVTGAAKRLGREIALTLAKHGWRVAVHYRSSEQDAINTIASLAINTLARGVNEGENKGLNDKNNANHAKFQCDLTDEAAVRAMLPRVIAHFGRVDAVVNNAAIFEHDAASTFSYGAMQKHLATNTGAAILLSQALHEHVSTRQKAGETTAQGAVVNLLDQKLWNQNPDFFSYTLSKAALEAANTMLAMELAPLVRVVGVAPGLTLTSHMISDAKFQELHKISPLGRSSTAQDVADAVRFALENRSITGTTLLVDGGQHLMRFARDFSLMDSPK